jgi:hypothetical protein
VPGAAQGAEGLFDAEEVGGGGGSEGDDDLGADDVDLFEEKGRAGVGLDGLGSAVGRGAAFDDVGDVDLVAAQAHGGDHVVEELAGLADEGDAGGILVGAGAFADEEEAGVGVAVAEDDVAAAGVGERAAGAVADLVADSLKRGGFFVCGNECGGQGYEVVEGLRARDGVRLRVAEAAFLDGPKGEESAA